MSTLTSLTYHFGELGVLDHHCVDDAEECFVAWEEACSPSEGVTLEHTLTGVFREDLDNTSTFIAGGDIPLEVSAAVFQHSIELVRHQLVRREDAEARRIPKKCHDQKSLIWQKDLTL
jgi:hypothetical protein